MQRLEQVVFLDRDGVINRDSSHYVKNWAEFEFLPRSVRAIRDLTCSGFHVIVITNQSAVGRQIITQQGLEVIHTRMRQTVAAQGGKITDIFFCPHHPDAGCNCRKPLPGLIFQARRKYRTDLASAWMVGDSLRDIACGRRAGCGHSVLVRTGNGRKTEEAMIAGSHPLPPVAADLYEAVHRMIIPARKISVKRY